MRMPSRGEKKQQVDGIMGRLAKHCTSEKDAEALRQGLYRMPEEALCVLNDALGQYYASFMLAKPYGPSRGA